MKITCDMCLDLMPLVLDGLASEDSEKAVREHIAGCEMCRNAFQSGEMPAPSDDKKILDSIKMQLRMAGYFVLVLGAAVGAMLTNSQNVFYNFTIMPVLLKPYTAFICKTFILNYPFSCKYTSLMCAINSVKIFSLLWFRLPHSNAFLPYSATSSGFWQSMRSFSSISS